ncbi:MAG: hypothetical protein JWO09_977 [Bacteroidetes bacterium]|nr:hypothetical protein [Bacteroidota bacterium]
MIPVLADENAVLAFRLFEKERKKEEIKGKSKKPPIGGFSYFEFYFVFG